MRIQIEKTGLKLINIPAKSVGVSANSIKTDAKSIEVYAKSIQHRASHHTHDIITQNTGVGNDVVRVDFA